MVAAVDPYRTALDENINVLRFTSLARQIKTNYTLPHSPSILTPSSEVPHYSLPTRSGRSHAAGPSIAKPLERITRHASSSSAGEAAGEIDPADESLVSLINEEDVNDGASEGSEDDDPLISSLFEEIRQLRQDAVQKELDHELSLHRVRQEERDRFSAMLEEQRQRMTADAEYQVRRSSFSYSFWLLVILTRQPQRELMEELMNRKIDNMKMSYDKMVGLLQEQLRLATEGGQLECTQDSVELDDPTLEILDLEDTRMEDHTAMSHSRNPLVPSKPSAVRQATSQATTRITRSSVASTAAADDTVDLTKSQSKGRRCV